ncbi:MAG: 7-cyano-7-deazaguanine synthase QueC [Candidatus Omnitrophica bacterium]|nr:7-cyano-7-deazaguanine synthase QueC [Candidatus Omnitrophota bacterium]
MKKAVILLSGGIDSAVTLYLAKNKGFAPTALIFDYGQRHKIEIKYARHICKIAGCPQKIIKLPFFWKGSSLLERKSGIPLGRSFRSMKKGIPSTYVPARNLVFLSIAVSFAETIDATSVFIGAHTEDYSGYPDCRQEFFRAFKKAIDKGTKKGKRIRIYTPLINKRKKDIIELGLQLGVPFGATWSCYMGGSEPCGMCDSCRFRTRAFRQLGIVDPYLGK